MRSIALALLLCLLALGTHADPMPLPLRQTPGLLCRQAIAAAAAEHGVPPGLMAAIGQVESGRRDPASGVLTPWPWTVDADGQGAFYDSKLQAIAAVRALQARSVRSIDVGCMQVNLMHHPDAFATLDQAFDPAANADYAARFLTELHGQAGGWPKAAALYHSATPQLAAAYEQKVMQAWPEGERLALAAMPVRFAAGAVLGPGLFPPSARGRAGPHMIARSVPGGGAAPPGRGLADYRAAPIRGAWRRPHG